ncbi:MAG: sec-independent protein translocase protein TatA [Kiritimatiellia bacterium]
MDTTFLTVAVMGMPGGPEVLIILFVILLLFGGKKLPELARSLGRSLGEFKRGREDSKVDELTKEAPASSDDSSSNQA